MRISHKPIYSLKDFRLAIKRRLNTQHKSDLEALPDATARKAALSELWDEYETTLKATLATANKHLGDNLQQSDGNEAS